MPSIIKLQHLCKSFPQGNRETPVLKDLSLEIEAQDFIAIVGASGSGKSTLMNILACLDSPTSGQYVIYGQDVSTLGVDQLADLRSKHFGFIFQRYHLIAGLSALENVMVPAIYLRIAPKQRNQKARQLLSELGLSNRLDYTPTQLSGGQQQRVSIARALMNGGEIIFADEPTGALDSKSGQEVMRFLQELNRKGHTIVMVTHDPNLAQQAKRIIEIKDGYIINDRRLHPLPKDTSSFNAPPTPQENYFLSLFSSLKENYKMALKTILQSKMRSFLTMLGIIFGIASVVSMTSIGNGVVKEMDRIINKDIVRTLFIYTGDSRHLEGPQMPAKALDADDIAYFQKLPYLKTVMPSIGNSGRLQYGNKISAHASLIGCSEDCLQAYDLELKKGQGISKNEFKKAGLITLIDQKTADRLFPHQDPIGKAVLVENIPMKVVGVVKPAGLIGRTRATGTAYIPYTTLSLRFLSSSPLYNQLSLTVRKGYDLTDVKNKVHDYVSAKHKREDFEIQSSDEAIKRGQNQIFQLEVFVILIASIALLVGGIGLMNIMLVSVSERMGEIGIRMAVGAHENDIKAQFLIEAIILCLIGGAIGILLSLGVGGGIALLKLYVPEAPIFFSFSIPALISALIFSSLIGLAFGYFPARNASRLDPVTALSRE